MGRTVITLCVVALVIVTEGKIFTAVELAQKLHSIHISDWDIPSLVCLAHNASQLITDNVSVMNLKTLRRNVTFYGIFGIPEIWLNSCKLHSAEVLDEDIENDVKCILDNLAKRMVVFDRTDYLGALTPHVVDLNKCFDWWEHLPRYVISPNERIEVPDCPTNPTPALSTEAHHTTHKPHPPVTTTCQCDSNNTVVSICLIFLNIGVAVLCYILWKSFVQRRTVKNDDTVQFM